MPLKTIRGSVSKGWDGQVLRVLDENGAKWELVPEDEDLPRVLVWAKGDYVVLKKAGVSMPHPWRGVRGEMGGRDSANFRIKVDAKSGGTSCSG